MTTSDFQYVRNVKGIYFLYHSDDIVYIGYSKNIYIRILEHFYNGKGFDSFSHYELKGYSANEMRIVENILIAHYQPELNKHLIRNIEGFYHLKIDDCTEELKYYEDEASFIIDDFNHAVTRVASRTIREYIKIGLSYNSFYMIQKFMKTDKDIVKQISEYFYKDRLVKDIKGIL